MTQTCAFVDLQAQPTLVVRTRASVDRLPEVLGPAWGAIMAHAGAAGAQPVDAPFAAFHNSDMTDLDVEVGMTFDRALPGAGDVQPGGISAGRAAECVHVGPYAQLHTTYRALEAWIDAQGLKPTGPAYEFYVDDPGATPEAELRTRVVIPVG
jgi:effector-binding domain-containing protein